MGGADGMTRSGLIRAEARVLSKYVPQLALPLHPHDTMAAPTRHLDLAMARAWPKLAALVRRIALLIGLADGALPQTISRPARILALRLLRPAEALVRRMVLVMARDMALGEPGLGALPRLSAWRTGRDAGTGRGVDPCAADAQPPANFRLFEPLATLRGVFPPLKPAGMTGAGPRILDLSQPLPPDFPEAASPETVSPAALARRLAALQRVIAAPDPLARRHAGFLVRKRKSNRPPGRTDPLRPGWAPGARSPHSPAWLREAIAHLGAELRAPPLLACHDHR